jgi:ATP-dependent Lon protease
MALLIAKEEETPKSLAPSDLENMLGMSRYSHDMWSDDMVPGVVTGLAWTSVGGEILFVETSVSKGKGKLTLTGNLGDVMKESAVLALEYVRSNASKWGLEDLDFDEMSFHIHVPEGAIPKDGPSAGITMMTSIMSALTQRKVKKRYAMTGEITLRGKVLPVGGIKEKILAAKRSGITNIIMSEENRKDVEDIKQMYVDGLTFHYVKYMSEVLDLALETKI